MKNTKLLLSSALLSGALLFSASVYLKNTSHYLPSTEEKKYKVEEEEGAGGAAQWLFNIQKNHITGTINPNDILTAREDVAFMKTMRSPDASLGLEWQELGPDNVGGRTRAILIDKLTPNKMFAGSVGGGLWVSTNNGSTWNNVFWFDQQPNLIISCITQAANGDIYVGTGEDLYNGIADGVGPGGMLGGGIYKSTNDGATFSLLPSTIPSSSNTVNNTTTYKFIGVNNLAADPINPNRIYAATRYGLQMTNDGGNHWLHPIRNLGNGAANTYRTTDVDVASDGTVIVSVLGKGYISPTGDSATFTAIPTTAGLPTSGISRTEFAFAPSDPNYLYALVGKSANGLLYGAYQSINKGVSWSTIGLGGSSQFEMFGTGQADYDMALAVYPSNKHSIIAAGVSIWEWKQTNSSTNGVGQWNEATSQVDVYPSGYPNPAYVHSDVHTIKFNPYNNAAYIGCDGGVFRATTGNGGLISPMNKGYNVTQFYSVAFEGDNTRGTGVMAGAQDNGTQYINGSGNTTKTAEHIDGGDGAECEVSFLNPNASFSTIYYGSLNRHSSKGGTGSDFYSWNISHLAGLGAGGFASFVTPIALYETKTATNSPDSAVFVNRPATQNAGSGNGVLKHFSGPLNLPQASATIVPGSIEITSGLQTITDNGSGVLGGDVDLSQANTINYATHHYDFYFNSPPATSAAVIITFKVTYAQGSAITIIRPDYVDPLHFNTSIAVPPGDSVKTYDPFQSKLAVGFSGSVFMTKGCLNFSTTPVWMKIGTISGTAEELAWSADGDILYVGTDNGSLYRFSNLAPVKDSLTGDIASPACVVEKTQIAGFGGRTICGLSVDPNNANKVAVSLGNYGEFAYVYYSSTAATCAATSSTINFSNKQGNLPKMPVYTVLIEKNNPKRAIIGTEHGVFSTGNITAASPVWTADNGVSGYMPNVPVFKIRQQVRDGGVVSNPYVIYAATHGRGLWKSETFKGPVTVGITKPNSSLNFLESGIKVYPNPMNESGFIAFNLGSTCDVIISIYNLQGKLVKSIHPGKLYAGDQKIEITTDELSKGSYLVSIDGATIHAASKFVVVK